jgi:hypothetical protein
VKSRVAFLYGDENASASVANFPTGNKFGFDRCPIILGFDHTCTQGERPVGGSRPKQLYMKFSRYGAGRGGFASLLHQMIRRRPIGMTVEQCSNDPAVKHSGKCLVVLLRRPFGNYFVTFGKTIYPKAFLIRGPAAETNTVW